MYEYSPKSIQKCCGITDVIFPDALETIGSYAFAECMSIRRVYIPKSVKQTHCGAFHNCFELVDVYYEGNENEWKHCGEMTLPTNRKTCKTG